MSLTPLEKRLDKAFQELSHGQSCFNCRRPACESHHREPKANKIYRWNKENALPVCRRCHHAIHFQCLKFPKLEVERIGLKDYLMREGLIFKEFLQIKKEELGV